MKRTISLLLICIFTSNIWAENPLPINWQELPEPYATKSSVNPGFTVNRPKDAKLSVPSGFKVEEYMSGFDGPRYMINGQADEIILSDMDAGKIYLIKNKQKQVLIKRLNQPFGLALYKDWLYVADVNYVRRYPYNAQQQMVGEPEKIIDIKKYNSGHKTRSILINEQEEKLYLSIGSRSNVSAGEAEARAAITRYNLDGTGYELYASGIRNAVGMRFHPQTNQLWVTSHERDGLGDDLVPDYFTKVERGGFYGWPYAYIGPHEDPRREGEAPELVAKTLYPTVLLGGHVGAMDVLFYKAEAFPKQYYNGAFIALHGSWNRSERAGYKIAFVPFSEGQAISGPEDFLTGWLISPNSKRVWGRPVGLVQMKDGSLLISDDGAGKLWRVSYP